MPFGTYRLEELSCSANWGMTLVNTVFSIREKGEVVDLGQLVDRAPALVTWAHDASDADKRIPAEKGAAVQDSVEITNLIEGSSYELRTTLIDAETKEQLTDAQGTPVEALTPFVAEETSTVLKAALSFDADDLAGKKLVVVEELLLEDIIVATNADSVSEDQTVSVLPTITTSARDKADGDSYVTSTQATIVDEVTYDGLVVGQVYKLDALLMDKATGNVARDGNGDAISGSREFVCEHETGSVDVEITLDTSLVGGHDIVVYEKLRQADNTELAAHEDIDDAAQTLKTSGLDTKASDSADGDEYYDPSAESVTICDTVSLSNIETGKEYTLTATLMDKTSETALESNGAKVRSTKTFVADKAYDTVEMELVFSPAEYAASDVVVYEVLSFEGNEVARHTDIDDEDQTVSSLTTATSVAEAEGEAADGADEASGTGKVGDETSSEGKTGYVATGDATQLAFVALLAALLATASAMRAMRFRRALMDSPARNGRCPP